MDIILNSNHSVSVKSIVVNQYENAHDSYNIIVPEGMEDATLYVIGSIKYRSPDKEKYSIAVIDICPDNVWTIYNKFTVYNGTWEVHFMLCFQEIDIEEMPVDLSAISSSTVYISDTINLTVNKVQSYDGFEVPDLSDGWTDAYDKIIAIYNEIHDAYENGAFKGDKGDTGNQGKEGYTPIKGVDYYTEADIQSIKKDILSKIEVERKVVGSRLIIGGKSNE